jgi:hypothetical protein
MRVPVRSQLGGLPNNPVVLSVGSDPEPIDSLLDVSSKCSVMFADAHGPKIAEPFEMQGKDDADQT